MEIQRNSVKTTPFYKILRGEVFKYNGNYFLKITNIHEQITCDCDSLVVIDKDYNSVYIGTGKAAYIPDNTEVIKVGAKLIVDD